MSRSNLPEQTRTNAMRSRCFGSMFAWILKMKPENAGFSGAISMPPMMRDFGAGACFRKPSSNSCTPKLLMALPKNTGVLLPASTAASSKTSPAVSSISSSSTVLLNVVSSSCPRTAGSSTPPTETGARYWPPTVRSKRCIWLVWRSKTPLKIKAVADGPVHRERADAQHALQFVQQRQRVLHRPVALVHEGEDRHAALAADLEQLARLRLDALGGINHHHHRVHGGEHAVGVLGEILVAGRVEQVEAVAVVIELQHRGADRDAALLFQLHPVGRRGALVFARGDRAGELHRAAVKQELLRQRGLARVRMRDDGERAPFLDFFRDIHKGREA